MHKAVGWVVQSAASATSATTPTYTILILPAWTEGSNTSYTTWLKTHPELCHKIATFSRHHFQFMVPDH